MFLNSGHWIDIGEAFEDLAENISEWSQRTFGKDSDRGPIGPLKHLEKEAREAQASPTDPKEYADILILCLDASRRAGIEPLELIRHAQVKMMENRKRTWPTPVNDEPVEHVRDE